MESASEGDSIIVPILSMNTRDSTSAALAVFVTVTSDFYPDLGFFYRLFVEAWLEARTEEKSDQS
jgi:hypothetical protein